MNCLLVAATAKEIIPFINHYRNTDKTLFVDVNVDILITGVGLTATTYHLTRHFSIKKPDIAIQAGIAGCFDKTIPQGSLVAVKQDSIADEAVMEQNKWKTLFDLKLKEPDQFPYKKGWLINPDKGIFTRNKYRAVKAISVNQVTTDKKIIGYYREKFQPVTESMEGAAFHYTCLSENVPFLQLRAISNYIGERNKKKWSMKEATDNLNKELIRLLESL
jgi:futalosine hydrolase